MTRNDIYRNTYEIIEKCIKLLTIIVILLLSIAITTATKDNNSNYTNMNDNKK